MSRAPTWICVRVCGCSDDATCALVASIDTRAVRFFDEPGGIGCNKTDYSIAGQLEPATYHRGSGSDGHMALPASSVSDGEATDASPNGVSGEEGTQHMPAPCTAFLVNSADDLARADVQQQALNEASDSGGPALSNERPSVYGTILCLAGVHSDMPGVCTAR
jgi:hypothetical protein